MALLALDMLNPVILISRAEKKFVLPPVEYEFALRKPKRTCMFDNFGFEYVEFPDFAFESRKKRYMYRLWLLNRLNMPFEKDTCITLNMLNFIIFFQGPKKKRHILPPVEYECAFRRPPKNNMYGSFRVEYVAFPYFISRAEKRYTHFGDNNIVFALIGQGIKKNLGPLGKTTGLVQSGYYFLSPTHPTTHPADRLD